MILGYTKPTEVSITSKVQGTQAKHKLDFIKILKTCVPGQHQQSKKTAT